MKAVILAAGQGKRLFELTADIPKSLLDVGGKTILEWTLDNAVDCGIKDMAIVVGFKDDQIIKKIGNTYKGAKITYISNPLYNSTNNIVSAWLVKDYGKDGFILINGDDIFANDILKNVVNSKHENAAVIDLSKTDLPEEAMKATVTNGLLTEVSKTIPKNKTSGDAIGIYKFSKDGARLFFDELKKLLEEGKHTTWYLAALNNIIKHCKFYAIPTDNMFWCEVDDVNDYENAKKKVAEYVRNMRV